MRNKQPLKKYFEDNNVIEIGVDEVGRGPMLGRVYSAAVILPKDDSFNHILMKDSKCFTSEKKIQEVAEYIKKHAIKWNIAYCSEQEIDELNIRQATHIAMHKAIKPLINSKNNYHILVDGNDFKILTIINENSELVDIPYTSIIGGDNKYTSIAAASILAKVARDSYIKELCDFDPSLDMKYDIKKNKGYGTKLHLDGIEKYGITSYHRKTFGVCKKYIL